MYTDTTDSARARGAPQNVSQNVSLYAPTHLHTHMELFVRIREQEVRGVPPRHNTQMTNNYVRAYLCIYMCMYTYIYIYICIHIFLRMYIYICVCAYECLEAP